MTDALERQFSELWPPTHWGDVTVLIAVSGGADSVALLRLLVATRPRTAAGRLITAHLDHGLRPESAADSRWVQSLCEQLQVECVAGTAPVVERAARDGDGIEAAARAERYQFLRATAEARGARYVAVAHSADDQAETILHRMVRGSGLTGLGGMRRARRFADGCALVRPLLGVRRAELRAYLERLEQSWLEDATNVDTRRTRARIRHELLPQLQRDFNPRVVDALNRLGTQAIAAQHTLDRLADDLFERAVVTHVVTHVGEQVAEARVSGGALSHVEGHLIVEVFRRAWHNLDWPLGAMGQTQWDSLAALLRSPAGTAITLPGAVQAVRTESGVLLRRGGA